MIPTSIKRSAAAELAVEWDDGHRGRHTLQALRRYCPCASCQTESAEHDRSAGILPILTPGKNELQSIVPVGSYAVQLTWKDGHGTGIYTFDYLRGLCECGECLRLGSE
jgi:DUF971 family protein